MSSSLHQSFTSPSILSKLVPTLPAPSGPYRVGFCDFEYQSPTSIKSSIENSGNILLRLFYPTSAHVAKNPLKRPSWSCHPKYLQGYLNFIGIPDALGFPAIYLLLGQARLPCTERGELATGDAYPDMASPTFPVLFFSHGLGGMRTTYSQICCDFASYGFIVASLEHLDGTACVSFSHGGAKKIPYARKLPFLSGQEARQEQLKYRVGEIKKCMEFISALHEGNDEIKIYDSTQSAFLPLKQHNNRSPMQSQFQQFKGRLNLSATYLSGHSFGATTAIEAAYQFGWGYLKNLKSSLQVKAVLALDPWMAQAGEHLFLDPLSRPTLVINTHLFQDQTSIHQLHRLFRIETADYDDFSEKESKMLTILNAGHQAQSDLALLLPSRLLQLPAVLGMFGSLNPEKTLKLTTQACREFLQPFLPPQWRGTISPHPNIFHPDPKKRQKDVIIGTSFYRA
ncbi:MAG: hypothetical protein ABIQ95_03995 [Bdellovibrionia bacterium]